MTHVESDADAVAHDLRGEAEHAKHEDASLEHTGLQKIQSPDFASSIQLLLKQHLGSEGTDTMQQQSTSHVMKTLLDAIHVLQDQVDALGKNLKKDESQPVSTLQTLQQSQSMTLHRVFCDKADHCHNKVVYEDRPTYDDDMGWGFDDILKGTVPIFNVGTYLSRRPSVLFVVFKEYTCAAAPLSWGPDGGQATCEAGSISQRAERLWVVSRLLREVIDKVAQFEPYNTFALLANAKEMDAPYNFLYHHYQSLAELAKTNQAYGKGLAPLISFLDEHYGAEYASAKNMFNAGYVPALHLGKLFRPGGIVVCRDASTESVTACILNDCISTQAGGLLLRGWNWGYNGTRLFRIEWSETIDAIVSTVEQIQITELAVCPFEFAPDLVIQHLEARGKMFWDMRIRRYVHYDGRDSRGQYHAGKRLMIDAHTYAGQHPSLEIESGNANDSRPFKARIEKDQYVQSQQVRSKYDKWPSYINHTEGSIPSEMLLILPHRVMGFDMMQKSWVHAAVDDLTDIRWSPNIIERLAIDGSHKSMLLSLTKHHAKREKTHEDLILRKGSGMIILLHGPPGVGKTLTAESVAEHLKKPLYSVTCSDIGSDVTSMEMFLENVTALALKWDSILLLDEADIFLEERKLGDYTGNAIVSVFLRILEYFDGIMFLTTNRVGTLDEAFKSRIHLMLAYTSPDPIIRRQIWRNFLDQVMSDTDVYLDELAALDISGRRIRNVVSLAAGIAKGEGEQVDIKHIRQAITASELL